MVLESPPISTSTSHHHGTLVDQWYPAWLCCRRVRKHLWGVPSPPAHGCSRAQQTWGAMGLVSGFDWNIKKWYRDLIIKHHEKLKGCAGYVVDSFLDCWVSLSKTLCRTYFSCVLSHVTCKSFRQQRFLPPIPGSMDSQASNWSTPTDYVILTFTYACIYIWVYACVCLYCAYICNIHTHKHTYIHTYTQT